MTQDETQSKAQPKTQLGVYTRPAEKFYGRRKGHNLSDRQNTLMDELLPRLSVKVDDCQEHSLDAATLFDHAPKEIWLEIGFGKGEHMAWQAEQNPHVGFLGCEPYLNGVAGLLTRIEENDISNIRIYGDDARHVLEKLPDASVSRVFLLHPDPWPKRRHAKRRFVNDGNLDEIARVLKPGGELRVGTDDPTYREWTAIIMSERSDFEWLAETSTDWKTRPADWPETRYNAKANRQGRPAVYFRFKRLLKIL